MIGPDQLKQVLFEINEVLEGRSGKVAKDQKSSKEVEEIAKVITESKLEIIKLLKNNKLKNEDLGSQFRNWENEIKEKNNISEIKSYQQQITQAIQAKLKSKSLTTNENKFSWPIKIALGAGIVGLTLGVMVIIYRVIKVKKVKK